MENLSPHNCVGALNVKSDGRNQELRNCIRIWDNVVEISTESSISPGNPPLTTGYVSALSSPVTLAKPVSDIV